MRYEAEQVGTTVVVRLFGELSTATAPRVRTILLKCLVEEPDAVVVDLAEAVVRESTVLSVLPAVSRQAALWPGIPLLISVPDSAVRQLLSQGDDGRLTVFPSVAQALAVPLPHRNPSLSDTLLPVSGAARRARELAREACTRWRLPHLGESAGLIASELASNAVVHARTMADLRFSLGHRYLFIAVRDGSTAEPRLTIVPPSQLRGGRGLMVVDAIASRWGSLPSDDGKVVWASLRLTDRNGSSKTDDTAGRGHAGSA
jgi:anti-anti-sigma regulatory factor